MLFFRPHVWPLDIRKRQVINARSGWATIRGPIICRSVHLADSALAGVIRRTLVGASADPVAATGQKEPSVKNIVRVPA